MFRRNLPCLLVLVASAHAAAVEFQRDIMPVLTKAGCNSGACHGAAVGRGEFRLSLYGGDPRADFQAIVRELQGRRINLADPAQSLIILKATETIEHGGGQRLQEHNLEDSQKFDTACADLASAFGIRPSWHRLAFIVLLAVVVAVSPV